MTWLIIFLANLVCFFIAALETIYTARLRVAVAMSLAGVNRLLGFIVLVFIVQSQERLWYTSAFVLADMFGTGLAIWIARRSNHD